MDKEKKPIYLDQEGFEDLKRSIDALLTKIKENSVDRKECLESGTGWGLPELEAIDRKTAMLNSELSKKYDELQRVIVVEKHNDKDIIDINDIVAVNIEYSEDEVEDLTLKLVANNGDIFKELPEVSINCPLGSSIYKKKVGDTCYYSVNGEKVTVRIDEKLDLEKNSTLSLRK